MSETPVRTHYRSLTSDGEVWCETRNPDEVKRRKHPTERLTYQRLDIFEVTPGWQPWHEFDPCIPQPPD